MKICIITGMADIGHMTKSLQGLPPYGKILLKKQKGKPIPPYPALGAVMLGTMLKVNGYEDVRILDFYTQPDKARIALSNGDFDLLGIHTTCMDKDLITMIAKICRESNPNSVLIAGGPEATTNIDYLINEKLVDAVVIGEGEIAILEIANAVKNGKQIYDIDGVYSSRGYTKVKRVENLDDLPLPDWSLLDLSYYLPILLIETMRGCPHSCIYCKESAFWEKPVRKKTKERVIEEIKRNIKEYRINTFRIADSTFTSPPKRAKEICDAIIDEKLEIKWSCFARAETITDELAKSMAESGCFCVDIGAESGSELILRNMVKGSSVDYVRNAIKRSRENGIIVFANFIMGFPGETDATTKDTIDLIKEYKPDTFSLIPLYIIPGTKLHEDREKYGIEGEKDNWKTKTTSFEMVVTRIKEIYIKEFSKSKDALLIYGGETVALIIASLGYNKEVTRKVFRTLNDLSSRSFPWILFHGILAKFKLGSLKLFSDIFSNMRSRIKGV